MGSQNVELNGYGESDLKLSPSAEKNPGNNCNGDSEECVASIDVTSSTEASPGIELEKGFCKFIKITFPRELDIPHF